MSNRPDFPGRADWYGLSNLAADRGAADDRGDGGAADMDDAPVLAVVEAHDWWRGGQPAEAWVASDGTAPQAWRGLHLATWKQRALAWLVDVVIWLALSAPGAALFGVGALGLVGGAGGHAVMALGLPLVAAAAGVALWQAGWRQGRRGQSWGKELRGLYVVRARDGQLLGGPLGLARCLGRIILLVTVILQVPSYLWPLRDDKRQTWEDKVVSSVVTAGR